MPSSSSTPSAYERENRHLEELYEPLSAELLLLESRINARLQSEVAIIGQVAHYLIDAGGKRIRPIMLLALAKLLNAPTDYAVELSAVIEFIHSATLLHDDVVDESHTRRGLSSSNHRFGNAVSVLVGDFLYSRAFQMMVRVNNLEVMAILSEATNTIAEGEVLQLTNIGNLSLTRDEYQKTIYCKTAKLFEASAELAVVLADIRDATKKQALRKSAREFGKSVGHAFQLCDDALDYANNADTTGKDAVHDLAEGKITLPLLIALEQSKNAETLKSAIANDLPDKVPLAMAAIAEVGGVAQTLALAKEEAELARKHLSAFPEGPARTMLDNICQFVLTRSF